VFDDAPRWWSTAVRALDSKFYTPRRRGGMVCLKIGCRVGYFYLWRSANLMARRNAVGLAHRLP
jgi:hypothetical protein